MPTKVDHVVVGSGASGLTAALLLAMNGRKVLVVEKAPYPGGSMRRFRCGGVPFDSGFHFTGGFEDGGLLAEMLTVLGIRDAITPIFLDKDDGNQFVMEDGRSYSLPAGRDRIADRLKSYFPSEIAAIDRYFEWVYDVCERTPTMNLRNVDASMWPLDEDYITLQHVLDQLTSNKDLQAVLSGFCMCYGARPADVSFANHARMCQALYNSVARVKDGGDAFVKAFLQAFIQHGVEMRCNAAVERFEDIEDQRARRMILSNGEEVEFESAVLTIHPKSIVDLFPEKTLKKAFINRVNDFEPSSGFFALFGVMSSNGSTDIPQIVSLFPSNDVNRLLYPGLNDESALLILQSDELINGSNVRTAIALEPTCTSNLQRWAGSGVGRRSDEYYAYKKAKEQQIRERVDGYLKDQGVTIQPITASSALTFRDYLHSPDGSAYGIRQKAGQINVFGKLPVRNLYAAGQNALLPGILGAMMSSFIVTRAVIDKASFSRFVCSRLPE